MKLFSYQCNIGCELLGKASFFAPEQQLAGDFLAKEHGKSSCQISAVAKVRQEIVHSDTSLSMTAQCHSRRDRQDVPLLIKKRCQDRERYTSRLGPARKSPLLKNFLTIEIILYVSLGKGKKRRTSKVEKARAI